MCNSDTNIIMYLVLKNMSLHICIFWCIKQSLLFYIICNYAAVYTDGSGYCGDRYGQGLSATIRENIITEQWGAYRYTGSSMDVAAITVVVRWLSGNIFIRATMMLDHQPVMIVRFAIRHHSNHGDWFSAHSSC